MGRTISTEEKFNRAKANAYIYRNGKPESLLKRKHLGYEHNVWCSINDLPIALEIVEEHKRKPALLPTPTRRRGKGARAGQALFLRKHQLHKHLPKRGRGRSRKTS